MKHLRKVQIILYRNNKELEILLLKTNRKHPIWQGITGGVEESDRNLKYAAVRELSEEIGIKTKEDKIIGPLHEFEFTTDRSGYDGTIAKEFCFAFEVLPPYEIIISGEHSEYRWLSFDEAIRLVDFENPKIVMRKVMEMIQR